MRRRVEFRYDQRLPPKLRFVTAYAPAYNLMHFFRVCGRPSPLFDSDQARTASLPSAPSSSSAASSLVSPLYLEELPPSFAHWVDERGLWQQVGPHADSCRLFDHDVSPPRLRWECSVPGGKESSE